MSDRKKNIAIGITFTLGLSLILVGLLFLYPTFGDGSFRFHARFTDIEKVTKGTRVTFAGRPVGHVIAVNIIDRQSDKSHDQQQTGNAVYSYDLLLAIDSKTKVYTSDEVTLSTSGLMGERYVAIIPKRAPDATLLPTDAVVYATELPSLIDTISQISDVAEQTEKTVHAIGQFIEINQDGLQKSVSSITETIKNFNTLLETANSQELIQSTKKSSEVFQETLLSMKASLDEIQKSQVIATLSKTTDNLQALTQSISPHELSQLITNAGQAVKNVETVSERLTSSWPHVEQTLVNFNKLSQKSSLAVDEVHNLTQKITTGEGSLGRLLTSDDFYFQTTSALNKVDTLLDDLNRYGILFHLSKGWQRAQKERDTKLGQLKTPEERALFLQEELAKVSTTLQLIKDKTDDTAPQSTQELASSMIAIAEELSQLQQSLKIYSAALVQENLAK